MKKSKKYNLSLFSITLAAFLLLGLAGCDNDDDENVEPVSIAYVALYHGAPDAPPLDIVMENRQINFYPLQYARYTGYLNFFSGERNMRVRPSGDANVIIDTTFTFVEGDAYSLFYVDEMADIKALLVEDELITPDAGKAAVRFVHLSPDAPATDVVATMNDNGNGTSSTSIADGQEYMEAGDFMMVDSGLQSFQVKTAGGDQVLLSIPDVNLASGGVYTIVARGYQSPPSGNDRNLGAQVLINY